MSESLAPDLRLCAVVLVVGYGLGSAPLASWIARLHGVDIMKVGTRNPGAANVFRNVSKAAGTLVLALDILKGLLAVVIASVIPCATWTPALAGVAAVVGHCYSVFYHFQGGAGLATAIGVTLALAPRASVLAAVPGLAALAIVRSTGHAAAVHYLALLLANLALGSPWSTTTGAMLPGAFVLLRHVARALVLR